LYNYSLNFIKAFIPTSTYGCKISGEKLTHIKKYDIKKTH